MTELGIQQLREIALDATQGEWELAPNSFHFIVRAVEAEGRPVIVDLPIGEFRNMGDYRHIATFGPKKVLPMLDRMDELEAARALIELMRKRIDERWRTPHPGFTRGSDGSYMPIISTWQPEKDALEAYDKARTK